MVLSRSDGGACAPPALEIETDVGAFNIVVPATAAVPDCHNRGAVSFRVGGCVRPRAYADLCPIEASPSRAALPAAWFSVRRRAKDRGGRPYRSFAGT